MHKISRVAGIIVGLYFIGVIVYLMNTAVIPLTTSGGWRTIIDVIAVSFYLVSGLPLIYVAMQELKLVDKTKTAEEKMKKHAMCIAIFLIFGLSP